MITNTLFLGTFKLKNRIFSDIQVVIASSLNEADQLLRDFYSKNGEIVIEGKVEERLPLTRNQEKVVSF
mgnify:CR=1 FL=1